MKQTLLFPWISSRWERMYWHPPGKKSSLNQSLRWSSRRQAPHVYGGALVMWPGMSIPNQTDGRMDCPQSGNCTPTFMPLIFFRYFITYFSQFLSRRHYCRIIISMKYRIWTLRALWRIREMEWNSPRDKARQWIWNNVLSLSPWLRFTQWHLQLTQTTRNHFIYREMAGQTARKGNWVTPCSTAVMIGLFVLNFLLIGQLLWMRDLGLH